MRQAILAVRRRGMPVPVAIGTALACALLGACGGGSSSAGSGSTQGVGNTAASAAATQSTNWTGYVRTGTLGSFTQISGSWTVPAPDCTGTASSASATWAGIGGFKAADPTLIQAGTEQDCDSGSPGYYAWWEGYPAPSQDISTSGQYPVSPGDQMSVTISSSLLLVWSIGIHDLTAGWTYSTTTPFVAAGESAEWIEEAPLEASLSSGTAQATLADFGGVSFSALTENSANPELTAADAIDMVDSKGNIIASPSAPGADGNSFSACYGSGSCN